MPFVDFFGFCFCVFEHSASTTSYTLSEYHEDRQGTEAPAEPGERFVKSPLQRILTAHIMGRWAKHKGALAHISLKRLIEMLQLQCAQRFPARPADPDSSLFAELFAASQPEPSQPDVSTAKDAPQLEPSWFSVGPFPEKVCNSFPAGRLTGFFLQEFRSAHPQDVYTRSQLHALHLQDVH